MTTRQKQLIENYIRLKVKKMINEKKNLNEVGEDEGKKLNVLIEELSQAWSTASNNMKEIGNKLHYIQKITKSGYFKK